MSGYHNTILECKKTLKRTLTNNQKLLRDLPSGTLVTRKTDERTYLYHSIRDIAGKIHEKLLSEAHRTLALNIQTRIVLEQQNKLIQSNLKTVEYFLKNYKPCDIPSVMGKLPPVYTAPLNYRGFKSAEELVQTRDDDFYSGGLIHKNSIGELFRSKGEVQVSEILLNHRIIYAYEPILQLPNGYVRPDFAVRLLPTDEPKYIEYCGMMDDPEYVDRTLHKIKNYLYGGYMPDRNVLFLFESSNSGMDVRTMKRRIEVFLGLK